MGGKQEEGFLCFLLLDLSSSSFIQSLTNRTERRTWFEPMGKLALRSREEERKKSSAGQSEEASVVDCFLFGTQRKYEASRKLLLVKPKEGERGERRERERERKPK